MKPKIIIDREPVSSGEIDARKDFRQLASQAKMMQKPFFQSTWFISSVAITGVLATLAVFSMMTASEPTETGTEIAVNETTKDTLPENAVVGALYYDEDSPCIHPPIPDAAPKPATYTVNNQKGAVLSYPTGSTITIPANALLDENGKPIQGDASISYREYHTVQEIMLSGIPMNYDSAGTTYSFQTAGMFDIHCNKDGKPLQLDEKKPIEIRMASTSADGKFNYYNLDNTQRNWVYLGKGKIDPLTENKKPNRIKPTDSVIVNVQFEGSTTSIQKNNQKVLAHPEVVKKTNEVEVAKSDVAKTEATKPLSPRKVNPEKYNFTIDIDTREFPELASFRNTRFEVSDESKEFNRSWYEKKWNSAKLREKVKGVSYFLDLTVMEAGKPNTSTVIVFPAYDGTDFETAKKKFDAQFSSYQVALEEKQNTLRKKEEELKKEIARRELEYAAAQKQEFDRQAAERRQNQRPAQETVTFPNNDFGQQGNFVAANAPQMVAYRTFTAAKFGTYNCDSPKNLPQQQVLVSFFSGEIDNEPKIILPTSVFLVDRSEKMYYTYSNTHLSKFGFDPAGDNSIVIMLSDGRVAVCGMDEFRKIDKSAKSYNFTMTVTKKKVTSEKELGELIFG
jgi:hypothetical protein